MKEDISRKQLEEYRKLYFQIRDVNNITDAFHEGIIAMNNFEHKRHVKNANKLYDEWNKIPYVIKKKYFGY